MKMTKRPNIRLGATAEYTLPGLKGMAGRVDARERFLETAVRSVPEMLPVLRKTALIQLQTLDTAVLATMASQNSPVGSLVSALESSPTVKPLTDALADWAARYNINVTWVRNLAFHKVFAWHHGGRDDDVHERPGTGSLWASSVKDVTNRLIKSEQFTVGPVEWSPTEETEEQFLDRTTREFTEARREYVARVHAVYNQRGWPKESAIEKRELQHFEWLALYQIKGNSFNQIAKAYRRERKTVEEAVKGLAAFIELPLRTPGKGGRPVGKKDTRPRMTRARLTRLLRNRAHS